MTNQPDDPIRARLTGHDPLHRQPHAHPAQPPSHLLEQIMNTATILTTEPSTSDRATATHRLPGRQLLRLHRGAATPELRAVYDAAFPG